MARFNGANLRYDNSDEQNRVYNLKAEAVMNNGMVEAVQNIELSKDGGGNGNGNIYFSDGTVSSSNFNFSGLPVSEYKAAFSATMDFAFGLVSKAVTEAPDSAEK